MMLESALVAHLLARTDITDVISDRLIPLKLEQEVGLPALVYQRIDTPPALIGHDAPTRFGEARIQLTVWAETLIAAKNLGFLIRDIFEGFHGELGSAVQVDEVEVTGPQDTEDPETRTPGVIVDLLMYHHY